MRYNLINEYYSPSVMRKKKMLFSNKKALSIWTFDMVFPVALVKRWIVVQICRTYHEDWCTMDTGYVAVTSVWIRIIAGPFTIAKSC